MRETIGSTWIYQLVILFILIFVSFLILALTYSKNFKNKNEVLNIIEKYEGVNANSVAIINNYLNYNGYKTVGRCPAGEGDWLASSDLQSTTLVKANANQKYFYCVKRVNSTKPTTTGNSKASANTIFYEVVLFYKFNLPVIQNVGTFTVNGVTSDIIKTKDFWDKIILGK